MILIFFAWCQNIVVNTHFFPPLSIMCNLTLMYTFLLITLLIATGGVDLQTLANVTTKKRGEDFNTGCFFVCLFFGFPTMHHARCIYSEEDSSGMKLETMTPFSLWSNSSPPCVCVCVQALRAELLWDCVSADFGVSHTHLTRWQLNHPLSSALCVRCDGVENVAHIRARR